MNEWIHKNYLDRLKEINLWTLEERRNRADLIELFKTYKGFTTVPFESLFTLDCNNKGTHGHLAKLSKPGCQKDVRKYFFSYRVINRWNAPDDETVSSSSINVLKNKLNKFTLTRMCYFMDWFWLALGLPDALPWKATRGEIPRWEYINIIHYTSIT